MPQIIDQLATIELSNDILKQIDIDGVYKSFSENYKKLDSLKNFRTDYEKKNWAMRWWHNDQLRDAQLDSAEVQSEFSKTIGQLMMISIMQSKRLAEQQSLLNEQQFKLKSQADEIAAQAATLQAQQHTLTEQSTELKNLVTEYFALKGLTEEGALKLIEIAREIEGTKDVMIRDFERQSHKLEIAFAAAEDRIVEISAKATEGIRQSEERNQARLAAIQRETKEAVEASEERQRAHLESTLSNLNQSIVTLAKGISETQEFLQSKNLALESQLLDYVSTHGKQITNHQEKLQTADKNISVLSNQITEMANVLNKANAGIAHNDEQQKISQRSLTAVQQELSKSTKQMRNVALGISITSLTLLGGLAYLMKLI